MGNLVYVDGGPAISGDDLNTFVQEVGTVALLRNFVGTLLGDGSPMLAYLAGGDAVNDGDGGVFYWNAGALNPSDDGINTIVPFGASSGCWSRLSTAGNVIGPSYVYVVPNNGDTLTAVGLQGAYILQPAGPLTSLNIVLPPQPVDRQIFEISTTQDISNLIVTAAGAGSVIGGMIDVLAANGGKSWRNRATNTTWYPRY